jgi:putative chitinase
MSIIKSITSSFKSSVSEIEEPLQLEIPKRNPFTFEFTFEKFKKLIPLSDSLAEEWYDVLYENLPKYNINTINRVAGFIAQTSHESFDFKVLEENLYYSAAGLRKTFPKYFKTLAIAKQYAKKPKLIANRVYGNRLGNSPKTDDGWNFRGGGLIQCTGKGNYEQCSLFLFKDNRLVINPDLLRTNKEIATLSACWYWTTRDINKYCDKKDIVGMTRAINGGTNGLSSRKVRFQRAILVLSLNA